MTDNLPPLPPPARITAVQFCDDEFWFTAEQMQAYARAAIKASRAAVPAGWVLVPEEPNLRTTSMLAGQSDEDAAETYRQVIGVASLQGCSLIVKAWSCDTETKALGIRCKGWCKNPRICPASYEITHRAVVAGPAAPQQVAQPSDPLLDCDVEPRPLAYPLKDYHYSITDGPLHFTWQDKPHRIVYDLIAAVRYYAQAKPEQAAQQWQPIETAPIGVSVLACNECGYVGKAILNAEHWNHIGRPTHWMPLPAPPNPKD